METGRRTEKSFGTLGGTGIGWYQGAVYFAADDRILRYPLSGAALGPTTAPVTLVSGPPT
jgi:hypothetical protein